MDKIQWNGYKEQLTELYNILSEDEYISCSIKEFKSHFTPNKTDYTKIKWNKAKFLLAVLINYLLEKNLIVIEKHKLQMKYQLIYEHFQIDLKSISNIANQFQKYKYTKSSKLLLFKLFWSKVQEPSFYKKKYVDNDNDYDIYEHINDEGVSVEEYAERTFTIQLIDSLTGIHLK